MFRQRSSAAITIGGGDSAMKSGMQKPRQLEVSIEMAAIQQRMRVMFIVVVVLLVLICGAVLSGPWWSVSSVDVSAPSRRALVIGPSVMGLTTTLDELLAYEAAHQQELAAQIRNIPTGDIPVIIPLLFKTITKCGGHLMASFLWRENANNDDLIQAVNFLQYGEITSMCKDGKPTRPNRLTAEQVAHTLRKILLNVPPLIGMNRVRGFLPRGADKAWTKTVTADAQIGRLLTGLPDMNRRVLYHIFTYTTFLLKHQLSAAKQGTEKLLRVEDVGMLLGVAIIGPDDRVPFPDAQSAKSFKRLYPLLAYIAANFEAKAEQWFPEEVEWAATPESLIEVTLNTWIPQMAATKPRRGAAAQSPKLGATRAQHKQQHADDDDGAADTDVGADSSADGDVDEPKQQAKPTKQRAHSSPFP